MIEPGHSDLTEMLPTIFIGHDRSEHAERHSLLVLMEKVLAMVLDATDLQERRRLVNGYAHLHCGHTPCASCLKALCHFTLMFPLISVHVGFADWGRSAMERPENRTELLKGVQHTHKEAY